MQQRLAAILAADIVDYTRMMGADQAATLEALRAFRGEVLRPLVAAHKGELIKDMGDGWLAEFASAGAAVTCAMAVQSALDLQPNLRIRIGVSIGDVVREGEDIFGDGVNIAARLQAASPPGGIALSGAVYSVLDGTQSPDFSDAGLHEFKNVAQPVHVWMRGPTGERSPERHYSRTHARKFVRLAMRPTELDAQDADVRDLAEAITQDILHLLTSAEWIAPYVTTVRDPKIYALSSVLRSRGDQLRLEVKLSDHQNEAVWSGTYDGAMSDSFDWQDEVGRQIATNVFGAIIDNERTRLLEKPLRELTADECLECAVLEFFEISDDTLVSSLTYVDHAISRDPDFAPAYLQGVRCVLAAVAVGYRNGVRNWLDRLPDWLDHAEKVPADLIRTRLYRGIWDHMDKSDPRALQNRVDEVIALAPTDLDVLCLAGWAYVWIGDPQSAIACFRNFESHGHFSSMTMAVRAGMATAMVQAGRDAVGAKQASAVLRKTREFAVPFRALAAASAHLGDTARAREAVSEALRLVPGDTLAALKDRSGFSDTPANTRFFDGLRAAGFPDR